MQAQSQWSSRPILSAAKGVILSQAEEENIDVVAFTGDIAFRGSESEYQLAHEWLDSVCLKTSGLNLDPKSIMFVPGNHDVDRSLIKPTATAIESQLADAQEQADIAQYYNDQDSKVALLARHQNYLNFCRLFDSPDLAEQCWSRVFYCSGHSIRFDGLNSSWLCRGEDDHKRLLIGQPQLTELMDKQSKCDLAITLFHHPLSDLMEFDEGNTIAHLRKSSDICLRGHLHNAETLNIQANTGGYLEIAAGALHEGHERPNRFNIIDISDDLCTVTIRTFVWTQGRWVLDRNLFATQSGIGEFEIVPKHQSERTPAATITGARPQHDSSSVLEIDDLEVGGNQRLTFDSVNSFPRFKVEPSPQDVSVRHSQLADVMACLKSERLAQVYKETGAKAEGFLAAVSTELQKSNEGIPALYLSCSTVTHGDDLQNAMALSANHSITYLGAELRKFGPLLLILDDLDGGAVEEGDTSSSIDDTVKTLLDFCPELHVIRTVNIALSSKDVRIGALDAADTRAYLEQSLGKIELNSAIDYIRIHRVTGGLPVHLDSVVAALEVTGLEEALAQVDAMSLVAPTELPRAIIETIDVLTGSTESGLADHFRSRMLLWILCILERGESLAAVKRLDARCPIWPKHANYLQQKGCIDVIDTSPRSYNGMSTSYPSAADKILRVPRMVRDYVMAIMSEEERYDLVHRVASLYFSDDWRSGRVRMRRRLAFGAAISTHQSGNEMTVLRHLASNPNAYFAKAENTIYSLALSYISQLKSKGFFGEAYEAAREFLGLSVDAPQAPDSETVLKLRTLAGTCARMIGEKDACVEFITDALPRLREAGVKSDLSDALVDLALALKGLGRRGEAESFANEVLDISPRESGDWFQAKSILAEFEPKPESRVLKLKQLCTRARNLRHHTVADNITLELVSETDNTEEKLKLLKVIKSRGEREYNYVRATIRRVETLLDSGRSSELTQVDKSDLWRSYNLAYSQRLSGIFDWCHRVCWRYLSDAGHVSQLENLLIYSSFVWRLNGNNAVEREYLQKLEDARRQNAAHLAGRISHYISKRLSQLMQES